ncbi:hypothetical protein KOF26_06655 [Sphingomonas sp. XMGL2]|uniref:Cytochrome c n=1 Tax=Sphingomonas quercus TaxID=2842451 RepID=A0ABS6BJZ9_9SPHN|nr:hypothetical protein [Sphingomonas quercus]
MERLPIAVALVALALIGAGAVAQDAAPAPPPPGPGLTLINERCGFCHPVGQVFQLRRTPDAWAATVQQMAARGAELSPEEIGVITDYLAKNYAPPPAAK